MSMTPLTGKTLRMARLSRRADDRYLFVPLDHSVADGPIASVAGFNRLVSAICAGGADALVVHKGRARMIEPELLVGSALVIHLSASTAHAPDANAKVLVGDVEEALRIGADAVSVHVNIAADLGADIVKTVVASPIGRMAEVIAASPLPVVVAGGDGHGLSVSELATSALAAG